MSRRVWSLHAYYLLLPGEQLDLFACQEVRVHLLARQLALDSQVDHTLCGGLLPAQPSYRVLEAADLRDRRLCESCLQRLQAQKRGELAL